jgi:hypothetical protein
LKKLDIYVLAFVATQNGVSLPLIGSCRINAQTNMDFWSQYYIGVG